VPASASKTQNAGRGNAEPQEQLCSIDVTVGNDCDPDAMIYHALRRNCGSAKYGKAGQGFSPGIWWIGFGISFSESAVDQPGADECLPSG
jgi:hypothetical protein